MKTNIILVILSISLQYAFSQDKVSLETYVKLSKEKDSLQMRVIKPLSDSLAFYENLSKKNTVVSTIEINRLKKENELLSKMVKRSELQIHNLSKKKLNIENLRLNGELANALQKNKALTIVISDKDSILLANKKDCEKRILSEKESTKKEALKGVSESYKVPFDDIITFSTYSSVLRDKKILSINEESVGILNEALLYFEALGVLNSKYDNGRIEKSLFSLNSIKANSTLKEELKKNIQNYKSYSDALLKLLQALKKLDNEKSAPDIETRKLKFNEIAGLINDYIYNYYEYNNYPYIVRILNGLVDLKKQDPDGSIDDFMMKI